MSRIERVTVGSVHLQNQSEPEVRPNVFVVGGSKCGTTSLHRFFELTSTVGVAKTRKELHFFSASEINAATAGPGDQRIPQAIVQDAAEYLAEHAHIDPAIRIVADVSPSYLEVPPAAARIKAFAADAKIVILLREPSAKVFSQYVHLWSEGRETLPFPRAFEKSAERRAAGFSSMFDYASGGFYAEHVRRYLDLFGPERVRVFLFEEMIADWPATRSDLAGFLGVELPDLPLPRMNVGGRLRSPLLSALVHNRPLRAGFKAMTPVRLRTRLNQRFYRSVSAEKPTIDPEMRGLLLRRFAADVAALEALLGRPTGWPTA